MTDKEYNKRYWLDGVDEALAASQVLLEGKIYTQALFYCQLAVEKQLKAIIVSKLDRAAPRTHDLVELTKTAKIKLSQTRSNQLHDITDFNLAARYDAGPYSFKQKVTRKYCLRWYKTTQEILTWLRNQ